MSLTDSSSLFSSRLGDDLLRSLEVASTSRSLFEPSSSNLFRTSRSPESALSTSFSDILLIQAYASLHSTASGAESFDPFQQEVSPLSAANAPLTPSSTGISTETTTNLTGVLDGISYQPEFASSSSSRGDQGGNQLSRAGNIGTLNGGFTLQDSVSGADSLDFYSFRLAFGGEVHLSLTGLQADADLFLIQDANRNGVVDYGEVLDASTLVGRAAESLSTSLRAGQYYVAVAQEQGSTNYTLNLGSASAGRSRRETGTCAAERFRLNLFDNRTVISGNGNVDFGRNLYDTIDAGLLPSSFVTHWNIAGVTGSGVAHDDGTGTRIFDSFTLQTGHQVLFEGIDRIEFRDRSFDFATRPNDPGFNQQWNLHMMGVHNAWRFTTGNQQVAIGIQDSGLGVDVTGNIHPDLRRRNLSVRGGTADDFFRNVQGPGFGPTVSSHGTGVQGIIAAESNNGYGISGINWNSTVINHDVLDANSGDESLHESAQLMINQAGSQGQRLIINMSLGAAESFGESSYRQLERGYRQFEAVVAQNPNTLFVIAAGNDGHMGRVGISSPAFLAARYSNVIAVGASWGQTDHFGNARTPGQRINYTYTGVAGQANWGSQYGQGLTVMGPSEVLSTMAADPLNGPFQFGFHSTTGNPMAFDRRFGGTSAAAPNVSGVASLVWSANSNLSAGQVKRILQETAYRDRRGLPSYNPIEYGAGIVNADAAVRRAIAMA